MTSTSQESKLKELKELDSVITKAIKKVGGRKENDLCKYIPVSSGGYIHHFTLRKMKSKQPSELSTMIEKFIINPMKPSVVSPKQRAPRGSRKRRDHITFTKGQLDKLLTMARVSGDKEIISALSPKKSLAACKRDLIQATRQGIVDHELWNDYLEAANAHQALAASITSENLLFQ